MDRPLLHIISHTDLDGVAAAALAWHVKGGRVARVSLTGYGEVDALILETLASGKEPLVLDLFCQKEQTIDEVDRLYDEARPPFSFRPPQKHLRTLRQQEMGRHRHELLRRARLLELDVRARAGLADEGGARAARADRAHSQRPRPLARADSGEPPVAGARHDVRPLGMFARLAANPSAELTPRSSTELRNSRNAKRRASPRRRSIYGGTARSWPSSATGFSNTATFPTSAACCSTATRIRPRWRPSQRAGSAATGPSRCAAATASRDASSRC